MPLSDGVHDVDLVPLSRWVVLCDGDDASDADVCVIDGVAVVDAEATMLREDVREAVGRVWLNRFVTLAEVEGEYVGVPLALWLAVTH